MQLWSAELNLGVLASKISCTQPAEQNLQQIKLAVLAYTCAFCALVRKNGGTFRLIKINFVVPKRHRFHSVQTSYQSMQRWLSSGHDEKICRHTYTQMAFQLYIMDVLLLQYMYYLSIYVTGPVKIDHVSANYTELSFC